MPFFRIGDRNIYFTHVPKCGGTTVERTLKASGVDLNFIDEKFGLHDSPPWYRSSPQHLTLQDRNVLFAESFFDYDFAIVRDPVKRFLSAFNHHRRAIGVFVGFEKFLSRIEKRNREHGDYFGYRHDNHFVPAARFCSDKTDTFAIETGLDTCLEQVAAKIGIALTHTHTENVRDYSFTQSGTPLRRRIKSAFAEDSPKASDLSSDQLERIRALYAEDYERFSFYSGGPGGTGESS